MKITVVGGGESYQDRKLSNVSLGSACTGHSNPDNRR